MFKKSYAALKILTVALTILALAGCLLWIFSALESYKTTFSEIDMENAVDWHGIEQNTMMSAVLCTISFLVLCIFSVWLVPIVLKPTKGTKIYLVILVFLILVGMLTWLIWGISSISAVHNNSLDLACLEYANDSDRLSFAVAEISNAKTSAIILHIALVMGCTIGSLLVVLVLYSIVDSFGKIIHLLERIEENTKQNNKNESLQIECVANENAANE